ncbi:MULTISPECIES: hypothetical protein [Saccharothrix]|uniref:hypothetical protein n=1 Tax=Saccharothrix TaxID=2071 RepID=UPI0013010309|nr:hypothetical protein [Saccharothrix sp. CB00851]
MRQRRAEGVLRGVECEPRLAFLSLPRERTAVHGVQPCPQVSRIRSMAGQP